MVSWPCEGNLTVALGRPIIGMGGEEMSLLLWLQRSKEVWDGHSTGLRSAPSGLSKG